MINKDVCHISDIIITAMNQYKPTDATTNPSLILLAAAMDQYQHILDKAIKYGKDNGRLVLVASTNTFIKI